MKKTSMLELTARVRMRLLLKPSGRTCSRHRTTAPSPGGSLLQSRRDLLLSTISPACRSKRQNSLSLRKTSAIRLGTKTSKCLNGRYFLEVKKLTSLERSCFSVSCRRAEYCLTLYPLSSWKRTTATPGSNCPGANSTALAPIATTRPSGSLLKPWQAAASDSNASSRPACRQRVPPEMATAYGRRFILTLIHFSAASSLTASAHCPCSCRQLSRYRVSRPPNRSRSAAGSVSVSALWVSLKVSCRCWAEVRSKPHLNWQQRYSLKQACSMISSSFMHTISIIASIEICRFMHTGMSEIDPYKHHSLSISFWSRMDSALRARQRMVERRRMTRQARPLMESRTMKRLISFEQSCLTLRASPIMISTTPTMMFPHTIDSVDSMSTFTGSPRVIAITSFEASMLKAPPRKKPVTPESTMQRTMSKVSVKKRTRQRLMIRQEQKRLQLFTFLLNITPNRCKEDSCWYSLLGTRRRSLQKQPRRAEPKTVQTLKRLGAQVEQFLQPWWVRQVGIHNRKPQSMDFSRPIDSRYILFSCGRAISRLKARNYFHFATRPTGVSSVASLSNCSSFRGRSLRTRNTITDMNSCRPAPMIITYSQWMPMQSRTMLPRKKPRTLPTSPLADQIPRTVPSVSTLNHWLTRKSSTGQAVNWQNPNMMSARPGIRYWMQKGCSPMSPCSSCMRSPITGMTAQPMAVSEPKMRQMVVFWELPSIRKRKKKPSPSEMQTSPSKRPRKMLSSWKVFSKQGLTEEYPIRSTWMATQAVNVSTQVTYFILSLYPQLKGGNYSTASSTTKCKS